MTASGIITAIIIGAIIGALGRLVLRGRQNISIVATIAVGIVAALIGTWLAGLIGVILSGDLFQLSPDKRKPCHRQ
jgi:uncharacterized membrane protein YeaQ/YmgE (transglycosylase-associated protein family)